MSTPEKKETVVGTGFYRAAKPGTFGPSEWLDLLMACQDGRATCLRVIEFIDRETVSIGWVQKLHPKILEVCWAIEKLPAGEQQTALSIQASAVAQEIQHRASGSASTPSADAPAQQDWAVQAAKKVIVERIGFFKAKPPEKTAGLSESEWKHYYLGRIRELENMPDWLYPILRQFARHPQPSASVLEAAERAARQLRAHIPPNGIYSEEQREQELATIIASHFAGFEQREGK